MVRENLLAPATRRSLSGTTTRYAGEKRLVPIIAELAQTNQVTE